jgi:hypothetical protein
VDEVIDVQRGMREKWAWIEMMGHLKRMRTNPTTESSILPADDRYIGVWLNGTLNRECAWLIHEATLPGYILSELPDYVPVQEDTLPNFYQRTEVEKLVLVPEACEYSRVALAVHYQWTTTEFHPIMETPAPRSPGAWVSIYAQLGIMPEQRLVFPRDVVRESDSARERSLYEQLVDGLLYVTGIALGLPLHGTNARAPVTSTSAETPASPPVPPRNVNPAQGGKVETNDRDPQRGMLVEIDTGQMLWVRPPNIVDVTSGAWSYFREKTEITESGKDETYMLKLGKAN